MDHYANAFTIEPGRCFRMGLRLFVPFALVIASLCVSVTGVSATTTSAKTAPVEKVCRFVSHVKGLRLQGQSLAPLNLDPSMLHTTDLGDCTYWPRRRIEPFVSFGFLGSYHAPPPSLPAGATGSVSELSAYGMTMFREIQHYKGPGATTIESIWAQKGPYAASAGFITEQGSLQVLDIKNTEKVVDLVLLDLRKIRYGH